MITKYEDLLKHVLIFGDMKENRTSLRAQSCFGLQAVYDLRDGFPLVTTKKMFWNGVVHELLWFLSGDCTNTKYLTDNNVHIWDAWAEDNGDVGPIYGVQWRRWPTQITTKIDDVEVTYGVEIDQLKAVITEIKTNPHSRRLIVSAWNVGAVDDMALPPCHVMYQFNVDDEWLDIMVTQRSADVFLGVPFNIASYALLLSMVAHVTGKKPRRLIHSIGNAHLYENHITLAAVQMRREPFPSPILMLDPNITDIDDFKPEHIQLLDYKCHAALKGEIAV